MNELLKKNLFSFNFVLLETKIVTAENDSIVLC